MIFGIRDAELPVSRPDGPRASHLRSAEHEGAIAADNAVKRNLRSGLRRGHVDRRQNLSIYDIHDPLTQQGHRLSLTAIPEVLRAEGFAHLPRRRDEERPERPRPECATVADVRQFTG
jgi:hypothetical protein